MGDEDADRVEDAAIDRQRERTEHVEDVLEAVREDLGRQKYPVESAELAAYYADTPLDVPIETEWIGSAFDRIDNSFEDAQEAYEALVTEYERGQHLDIRRDAVGHEPPYWEESRADSQQPPGRDEASLAAEERGYRSGAEDARRRAREAEASAADVEVEADAAPDVDADDVDADDLDADDLEADDADGS
ncbi:MAG: hypothetical protein ABEJ28_11595 [Salinigranum sp.]